MTGTKHPAERVSRGSYVSSKLSAVHVLLLPEGLRDKLTGPEQKTPLAYLGKLLHEVPPERPGEVNRSIGLLEGDAQHRSEELSLQVKMCVCFSLRPSGLA